MSDAPNAGDVLEAESIVAELRRIVQLIPPISFDSKDNDPTYAELYMKSVSTWLDNCMLFGQELVRSEGIWFESRTPQLPRSIGWFARYLGAAEAWLTTLYVVLRSEGDAGALKHESEGVSKPESVRQHQMCDLVTKFGEVISTTPSYLRLDGEQKADTPTAVIAWTLSCANLVVDRLATSGIRSRMDVPRWGSDVEKFMGALDTWHSMLQEAVDRELQPVAA